MSIGALLGDQPLGRREAGTATDEEAGPTLELPSGQENAPATTVARQTDISPKPDDRPLEGATRVRFPESDDVAKEKSDRRITVLFHERVSLRLSPGR